MNPKHYNYICLDPTCDNLHCKNTSHYDTTKFTRDIIKKAANSNKEEDYCENKNGCMCDDDNDDDEILIMQG